MKLKERYIPKKYKNPIKAIRENCIECMGGRGGGTHYSELIKNCASVECALYEFRFGENPFKKVKKKKV